MQKALLYALLQPSEEMARLQEERDFTRLMMRQEEMKTYPFGDVWDMFCERTGVPAGDGWYEKVMEYEKQVLAERR